MIEDFGQNTPPETRETHKTLYRLSLLNSESDKVDSIMGVVESVANQGLNPNNTLHPKQNQKNKIKKDIEQGYIGARVFKGCRGVNQEDTKKKIKRTSLTVAPLPMGVKGEMRKGNTKPMEAWLSEQYEASGYGCW